MTLTQSQGHQTCNENVEPGQGYDHANFERSHFNSVRQKGYVKGLLLLFVCLFACLLSNEEIRQLSPLNKCTKQKQNSDVFMIYLT